MEHSTIPLVDFANYSLDTNIDHVNLATVDKIAADIYTAFTNIGFVYLKNHGIKQEQVDEVTLMVNKFVSLPNDVKSKYGISTIGHGWVPLHKEILHPDRPADIKECYNTLPQYEHTVPNPNIDIPGFREVMNNFFKICDELVQRILHVIGVSLNLKDPYYFCKLHNTYRRGNRSSLRTLYYPAIDRVLPGQLRCAEHSDWGSITLLFQDEAGGLEIMSKKGEFVAAKPIPGSVIVNVGDIMQRWTDDKLVSTIHRVALPTDHTTSRNSVVFFAQPDSDCEVTCLDGCNKYPPIVYDNYLNMKIKEAGL